MTTTMSSGSPNATTTDPWYHPEELRSALKQKGYSNEIADDLCTFYAEQLNKAHKKGRQHGMQRAVQLISPENPMSNSSYAQGRNECCRIIRTAMEKET